MANIAYNIDSTTPQTTHRLGQHLGALLDTGMVVCLTGDLGSGKTVLVQGLARGLAVPEDIAVTSPTYALIHDYPGRVTLYHSDLYRLPQGIDPDDFELGDTLYGDGIVVIEWADRLVPDCLHRWIAVELEISGETSRRIRFSACGQRELDLIKKLGKLL